MRGDPIPQVSMQVGIDSHRLHECVRRLKERALILLGHAVPGTDPIDSAAKRILRIRRHLGNADVPHMTDGSLFQ